ncbi:cytochrome C oxidase subunit II [Aquisalibacillus elongatus]|uniref:Cytochrome c oxidase subunit 2 n=1 Tax=Aquisalibacillus elongatus TaxID=485577 RepID=A0A3N5B787_9BACI|nr:cytochrome C oxidase subunit II [Aquisalibacillus elongatus]RPF53223.1 hypothetical protein EDC24_1720 [Aquisalibacillus elongatus]
MKKWLLGMLVVFIMFLAACGGDEGSNEENHTQADPSNKITLEASNFEFNQDEYQAESGDVTVELKNVEGMHGITIDGVSGFEIDGDGSKTVNLEPGEYTIRCSIMCGPGHADMVTTLVVS